VRNSLWEKLTCRKRYYVMNEWILLAHLAAIVFLVKIFLACIFT